ncbi:GNAT family N-acetyltransferase [Chitinilyticum piscinae]|uniref:GNAT family N-acetyltransferase n=1 Tax=Chitinilyticum piscinae TaxID=2866724 RepID=A0A8J7KE49_9NEIS|nr:GNAT family N-acetyltransferase [Chitinilyticum piscinae]MBE9609129.1 GNAT family N-acetyltransferase [Chitinilyticum piscinae]
MSLPTLLTSRLILRPLLDSDAATLAALASDPEIARRTRRSLLSADDVQQLQHELRQPGCQEKVFVVCRKSDRQPIGCTGLILGELEADVGYWIAREHWGQGFATEALRATADFAFQRYELWQLTAHHLFDNPASGRVLAKAGFELTGFRRVEHGGQQVDALFYQLLRAKWIARPDKEGFL